MSKPKRPEDLSEQELRRLLLDKRRVSRQRRLERFRRSGRAVLLAPDLPPTALDEWRSSPVIETQEAPEGEAPRPSRRRRWFDGLLGAVEVLAVVGLVGLIFTFLGVLRDYNREAAAANQPPVLTPTPLITAVVLPGGHTPPDSPSGPQPNEAEIPEHLRPLVQSLANIPVPTQGPEQAIRIQIPAIKVDATIVQGDGWEQLKKGVGQHIGSANPGQPGNVVLTGHDDVYGEVFRYLKDLKPGDVIILYTTQRQFVYIITSSKIVEPGQVELMNPTAEPTVTLITCHPYMVDNKRYVVLGTLQNP